MKQRYESYKPSGIDWIGEIPSHWKIMPFKRLGTMNTGLTFTKADLVESGDPVISYGQIHSKTNNKTQLTSELIRFIPRSISGNSRSSLVSKGSFIFADTSEDLDGCGNAVYNDAEQGVYAGYHTIVFKRNDEHGKFLAYLFQTDAWRSQIRSQVSGVKVFSITQTILGSTYIILPPLAEQEAIAAWLDVKCGEIDAAVAKVDREIELIDELKQSEISRVVTRGLNPDAPLRPSGIDWIGDVPEHWEVTKGKYLLNVLPGYPADSNLFTQEEVGIPLIRIRDINSDETEIRYTGSFPSEYIITQGDILVGMDGDFNVANWKGGKALLNQRVCKVIGFHNFLDRYVYYCLPFLLKRINDVTYATTVKHLSTYDITKSFFPFPPLSEQREIADYLDKKCAEIDGLKEKLKRKRETLVELRQSLISEVVTGKRRVATCRDRINPPTKTTQINPNGNSSS